MSLGILSRMQQRRLSTSEARFVCRACHKVFVLENRYLQHECKQMKREAELQTPVGQAAWNYYQLWMRGMKRMPPSAATFLTSKYFRTFINFTTFVKSVDLPKPDKFIWLMQQKGFSPTMWCTDDAYSMYLEFLDRKTTPLEQAKLSVETLLNQADKREIDVSDVFSHLKPHDIIQYLRSRRLSPWLLLFSKKFKKMFAEDTSTEQRIILENLIRPEYWGNKMADNTEAVAAIKMLVEELDV